MDDKPTFESLGLDENVCKACKQMQWDYPTPVQVLSIPPALNRKNLSVLAETGSGKTGAYLLPIIQTLLNDSKNYFAVVFAPTRELGAQIQAQFSAIGKVIGLHAALLVGGVPITEQAKLLRMKPPHVIVATPGRFLDHIQHTKGFDELKFANLKFLVIDEADRMLGSDFQTVIERILTFLPRTRQTFLYSATMTDKVGKMQRCSLRNPVKISTLKDKFQSIANLKQFVHLVPQEDIDATLIHFLNIALIPSTPGLGLDILRLGQVNCHSESTQDNTVNFASIIIFTRTREASNRLALLLRKFITNPVVALNGDMPQSQRLGALNKFKKSQGAILVATDVASRGLDIPQVGLVINYDVPLEAKTYMHRVGRTARVGRHGCALTLLTQYSVVFFVREIEAHLKQSNGQVQAKIPSILSAGTADEESIAKAEQQLEQACSRLQIEVMEALAQAKKTVENMRKKAKKSRTHSGNAYTSINDHVEDVSGGGVMCTNPPSEGATKTNAVYFDEIGSKSGMRRTGWASEAPIQCQAKIAEVMKAFHVPNQPSISSGNATTISGSNSAVDNSSVASNYANISHAFAKKQKQNAKKRQRKEDKFNSVQKNVKKTKKGSGGASSKTFTMKPFKR